MPTLSHLLRPLFLAVLVVALGLAPTLAGGGGAGRGGALADDRVVVTTASGPVAFAVELADDDSERARGLMFRESLAPNAGMLFDFKREQPVSFWMKNTLISLDMFFIKADGTIVHIAERTEPLSERGIPSPEPVRAVLETNAGVAASFRIRPGDVVHHPIFGNAR